MKRFLVSAILLLLGLALSAQSLTGKWTLPESDVEEDLSMTGTEVLDLRENGSFEHTLAVQIVMKMDEETTFHVSMLISAPGSWTREGETLTLKPVRNKAKAEIVDTDMPGIIKTLFANSIKNELLKELRKPITARIVSVTEDKLVLLDPDEKDPANQLSEYTRTK